MYPDPNSPAVHIPHFELKPVVVDGLSLIPGTKQYVVLDEDGALAFESDDKHEAFSWLSNNGGTTMIDRGMVPRVNTFAGTFTTPPKV